MSKKTDEELAEDSETETAEWEAKQDQLRREQNLPEGAVPEQRPIASQTVDNPHSRVYNELTAAGDPRGGGQPAMGKEAYDRADSQEQKDKAASESQVRQRLYPGARAYVEDPGAPDHGRAVAINGVATWASFDDQLRGTSGVPAMQDMAIPAEYEVCFRDGRAENSVVAADKLRVPNEQGDWGRTSIS